MTLSGSPIVKNEEIRNLNTALIPGKLYKHSKEYNDFYFGNLVVNHIFFTIGDNFELVSINENDIFIFIKLKSFLDEETNIWGVTYTFLYGKNFIESFYEQQYIERIVLFETI